MKIAMRRLQLTFVCYRRLNDGGDHYRTISVTLCRLPQRRVCGEDRPDHVCSIPGLSHHRSCKHSHRNDEQHLRGNSGLPVVKIWILTCIYWIIRFLQVVWEQGGNCLLTSSCLNVGTALNLFRVRENRLVVCDSRMLIMSSSSSSSSSSSWFIYLPRKQHDKIQYIRAWGRTVRHRQSCTDSYCP